MDVPDPTIAWDFCCPHLSSEAKSNLPELLRGDLLLAGTGEMNHSLVWDWTLLWANAKSPMNEHDLEHPCCRWWGRLQVARSSDHKKCNVMGSPTTSRKVENPMQLALWQGPRTLHLWIELVVSASTFHEFGPSRLICFCSCKKQRNEKFRGDDHITNNQRRGREPARQKDTSNPV